MTKCRFYQALRQTTLKIRDKCTPIVLKQYPISKKGSTRRAGKKKKKSTQFSGSEL